MRARLVFGGIIVIAWYEGILFSLAARERRYAEKSSSVYEKFLLSLVNGHVSPHHRYVERSTVSSSFNMKKWDSLDFFFYFSRL